MDSNTDDNCNPNPRPRTLAVLATLMGVALAFSWLVAYAFFDALVAAELIVRTSSGQDPRPRWLIGLFTGLMLAFGIVAVVLRFFSRRQLARIDEMIDDE